MVFSLNQFRETPYNLQFTFAGKMYQWQYSSGFITGITNLQIRTSTDQIVHLIARQMRTASTGINVKFVENPTIVSTGTISLPSFNTDRRSASTSVTVFASNVTSTSGDVLENINLVSANTWQQLSPELVLNSGIDYNVRITNTSSTDQSVNFNFVWYESDN